MKYETLTQPCENIERTFSFEKKLISALSISQEYFHSVLYISMGLEYNQILTLEYMYWMREHIPSWSTENGGVSEWQTEKNSAVYSYQILSWYRNIV